MSAPTPQPRILIVEDDPDGRRSLEEVITDAGCRVQTAQNGSDGLAAFVEGDFDVVITDLVMPDMDGLALLRAIRERNDQIPVIMITAYGSVSSSVEAIKSGAYDYITKPLDLDDIEAKVRRAAETGILRRRVEQLSTRLDETYGSSQMVAEDPKSQRLLTQIEALSQTAATVMLCGESGTGKEVAARALHAHSARANGPFVAVNCGALTETLLESELFGHEKGSFTGALRQHRGAFERADGGTLFLDEVGDAPPSVQVKLLRVLEEREVTRIGGQTTIPVDARVISATNQDLSQLISDGAFREDLYYRLNVVSVELPPLRTRRADIVPLAQRFLRNAANQHGKEIKGAAPGFFEALQKHSWPGNIRELRNVIEAAVVMAASPTLTASDLNLGSRTVSGGANWQAPVGMTLQEIEREILIQTLQRNNGNRTLTAEELGLSRRTIQRKIKEHDLES
jgi:two-component system response regulator HydG